MSTLVSDSPDPHRPIAVITGASAGFGAATARALAQLNYEVVLGARRYARIEPLAAELRGRAIPLDVTKATSVEGFARQIDAAKVVVANAGKALGMGTIAEGDEAQWREMLETNVLGLLRTIKALLPALRAAATPASPSHLVIIGSVAGVETYFGGGGYAASKHGAHAVAKTMRLELNGEPIRVTEILPGLAETEFSLVRFGGDAEKAKLPYRGLTPLSAEDIADAIAWAVTRPAHVNIDEIHIKPIAQATATVVSRKS